MDVGEATGAAIDPSEGKTGNADVDDAQATEGPTTEEDVDEDRPTTPGFKSTDGAPGTGGRGGVGGQGFMGPDPEPEPTA